MISDPKKFLAQEILCEAKSLSLKSELAEKTKNHQKTQTRRPIKGHYTISIEDGQLFFEDKYGDFIKADLTKANKIGQVGDILWLRESAKVNSYNHESRIISLEFDDGVILSCPYPKRMKWKPKHGNRVPNGIFKEAARYAFKITKSFNEKLEDISNEDAIAEGISSGKGNPSIEFIQLWKSIYKDSKESDDWVIGVKFELI